MTPPYTLSPEQLHLYQTPSVYAALKNNRVLYIGKAQHGLERILKPDTASRLRRLALETAREIKVIPCQSHEEACALEAMLIRLIQPVANTNLTHRHRTPARPETSLAGPSSPNRSSNLTPKPR